MKRQEMVMVNGTNDWTKINLEDYDFDNVALQEAQYIFQQSKLFDFIFYVLWSEYDEDTFKMYCKTDPVVQKAKETANV